MRALKALVIIMGVLIVAGTGVVIYTVAKRVSQSGHNAAGPVAASLTLPAGCGVAEMTAVGDRLALRLAGDGECRQIMLVDPATGAITGHIGLGQSK
jgi:hypothetical protein